MADFDPYDTPEGRQVEGKQMGLKPVPGIKTTAEPIHPQAGVAHARLQAAPRAIEGDRLPNGGKQLRRRLGE